MKRAILVALAFGVLQACDTPSGQLIAEPLSGARLEARLSGQKLTFWRAGERAYGVIFLRPGGTGSAEVRPSGSQKEIYWKVRAAQLCIADVGDALDCARPAISGNNITVRFERRRGGLGVLSGTLAPI